MHSLYDQLAAMLDVDQGAAERPLGDGELENILPLEIQACKLSRCDTIFFVSESRIHLANIAFSSASCNVMHRYIHLKIYLFF